MNVFCKLERVATVQYSVFSVSYSGQKIERKIRRHLVFCPQDVQKRKSPVLAQEVDNSLEQKCDPLIFSPMTTSQMECEQISRMMKLSASEVDRIHTFDVENYTVM